MLLLLVFGGIQQKPHHGFGATMVQMYYVTHMQRGCRVKQCTQSRATKSSLHDLHYVLQIKSTPITVLLKCVTLNSSNYILFSFA